MDCTSLTTPEATQKLRCSRATLYRLLARGELRQIKVGAKTLWPLEDIERILTPKETTQ